MLLCCRSHCCHDCYSVTDLNDVMTVTLLQISKVPVQSCRVYGDCAECVTTKDPLNCGWCGDHCSTNTECLSSSVWQDDSCPPSIHSVRVTTDYVT